MNDKLTNGNFLVYCAKHYNHSQYYSTSEFIEDIQRIKYIKKLIYTNDYELFMFLMGQMNKLKLFQNTFYYYESARIIDCIDDNTDYKIIYELLKLNIEPKYTSKYYPMYKMINNSYL